MNKSTTTQFEKTDSQTETEIRPVATKLEIEAVVILGKQIWNQHYVPIIGQGQVDYMLNKFQSISALTDQIENQKYYYFMIFNNRKLTGYIGLQDREDTLFLSKIYLTDNVRGKGIGKIAVDFCVDFARKNRFSRIELTVNKNNVVAITAYQKIGFEKIDAIVTDIGGGYVMDDYVFEMTVDH
jgi:RimJ/RimL family protein N-acetyltransferase